MASKIIMFYEAVTHSVAITKCAKTNKYQRILQDYKNSIHKYKIMNQQQKHYPLTFKNIFFKLNPINFIELYL